MSKATCASLECIRKWDKNRNLCWDVFGPSYFGQAILVLSDFAFNTSHRQKCEISKKFGQVSERIAAKFAKCWQFLLLPRRNYEKQINAKIRDENVLEFLRSERCTGMDACKSARSHQAFSSEYLVANLLSSIQRFLLSFRERVL